MNKLYNSILFFLLFSGSGKAQNIPDSFSLNIPVQYNHRKLSILVFCEKDNTFTEISGITSTLPLPKEFYAILQENFRLANWAMPSNYSQAYKLYKSLNFEREDFVAYKKSSFSKPPTPLLYIIDANGDGYEDILLPDLQNSVRDFDKFVFFEGGSSGFSYDPNFFGNLAFYGWDSTGKYLFTGTSDTRERRLYKNKIVNGKLKVIAKCKESAVSGKSCR